jgi:hypothetical protein
LWLPPKKQGVDMDKIPTENDMFSTVSYTHEGSAPRTCFCIGRACPSYERCFEKEKIIARYEDMFKKIMIEAIRKENTPKENSNGNGL